MINKNIVTYLSEATSKYIPIYLSNPIKETHQPKIPCNGKKSKMTANKNKRYIRLYDQLMYDKTHGISPANATKWNETPNNQYSQKQVFFPVNQLDVYKRQGITSSVSISPNTLSAAAFTELKNTNFFADDSRKKSNIFCVNPVLISKYT